MNDTIIVRKLSVEVVEDAVMLRNFLARHSLGYETDIDAAFGIFDECDALCGCRCQSFLKCFAANKSLRRQNALGVLASQLMRSCFFKCYYGPCVIM